MIIYHQQSMREIQKLIKNVSGKVLTHQYEEQLHSNIENLVT